jgi:hypothetical protein
MQRSKKGTLFADLVGTALILVNLQLFALLHLDCSVPSWHT